MIAALENEQDSADDDLLVEKLVAAAAMGLDRQKLASDATYWELVESGQLNLLSDRRFEKALSRITDKSNGLLRT